MKKLVVLLCVLCLSGALYAESRTSERVEAKNESEDAHSRNSGVEYNIHKNDDSSSEGYCYAYLIDFYNYTDKQVRVVYDYRMESDGRWIRNNSFHLAPAGSPGSSARNYYAGDVGEVHVRWE